MGDNDTAGAAAAPSIPDRRRRAPLRVLALAGSDAGNGAGVLAARLHESLLARGLASRLLVKHRMGDARGVEELRRTRLGRWLLFHAQRIERRTGYHLTLHPSSPGSPFAERIADADVLQLHDIHSSFVSPASVARWSHRLPVVWTLHDMWAATGKCIAALGCERWLTGCGACPQLAEWPSLERDRTDFLWRWKRRLFAGARFRLVCPSEWLADVARRSPLLAGHPVTVIPNSVDTRVFAPGPKDEARRALGIAADAVVVAFASNAALPRKGFAHLLAATAGRRARGALVVLAVGERLASAGGEPGVVWTGTVASGDAVASRMRAADVLCLPTLGDSFGLVLIEAAATGIPSVTFDAGGTREAVRDGETAFVVPAGDVAALGRALETLADDPARRTSMGAAARALAEREFDVAVAAARYEALYEQVAARG